MLGKILTTPVDDLVEFIKNGKDVTTSLIKEKFNVPNDVVERWIVVLEEYKVITVKYHGFEGFISFVENVDLDNDSNNNLNSIDVSDLKDTFLKKARVKNFSLKELKSIWPKFILTHEIEIKSSFVKKAEVKGYKINLIESAWQKYREELVKF